MLPPHFTFHSKVCTETGQNDATPHFTFHCKVCIETGQNDASPHYTFHRKVCLHRQFLVNEKCLILLLEIFSPHLHFTFGPYSLWNYRKIKHRRKPWIMVYRATLCYTCMYNYKCERLPCRTIEIMLISRK